jgi:hypothetical protein
MPYTRVIPRDLFNEAKLLKCLGHLALTLHDYEGRWPLTLNHEDPESGFVIDQDENTGNLYCLNLELTHGEDRTIGLSSVYNSKSPYPLIFSVDDDGDYVFDDNGNFSAEFLAVISAIPVPAD